MAHARHLLVTLGCFGLLRACGDDSATSTGDSGTGADTDASAGANGPEITTDAGATSTGANQGKPCDVDGDCKGTLSCVSGPPGLGDHCGRACLEDSECLSDLNEQCISYSGSSTGLHCATINDEPFSACSIEDNLACAPPMVCLPPGVCIEICEFGDDADAGVDSDAGVGGGRGTCSREQDECQEGILIDDQFGACANFIERGEVCGEEEGLCAIEDLCAPDPLRPVAQNRCLQRCGPQGLPCDDSAECRVIGAFADGSDASVCQ